MDFTTYFSGSVGKMFGHSYSIIFISSIFLSWSVTNGWPIQYYGHLGVGILPMEYKWGYDPPHILIHLNKTVPFISNTIAIRGVFLLRKGCWQQMFECKYLWTEERYKLNWHKCRVYLGLWMSVSVCWYMSVCVLEHEFCKMVHILSCN